VGILTKVEIMKDIYWVGAVDWNARHFHGYTYTTHRGTTYNSYLIMDEKVTLVDTVYAPFASEMIERIRDVVDPSKIEYVIANHVEPDHSSSIVEILKLAPNAKLYGTARCKQGLQKYYNGNWDFTVVKTGDEISLGRRKLRFIEAPMLHWPDSMFTYSESDELLMPNDAFGQHIASSFRYEDEVNEFELMEEAAKYYANILLPLSGLVTKKIEEIVKMGLKIRMIAPSHGVIWRKDPMKIVNAYMSWAKGESKKKVLIVYDTMWLSTEKMAKAILEGIRGEGIEAKLYRLPAADESDIFGELLVSKGLLLGSSTINNGVLPTLGAFLVDAKGLKPKGKVVAVFGSYGWAGGATKVLEDTLKEAGMEVVMPPLTVNWAPTAEELQKCLEFGRDFAKKL
jgi:anaerobic nitric oxide reductase flavorubredoxin